ncbi:MAG: rhomboid family intramembrane serine protease, partial [Deinococcus sp.]|nr:rhomboid family intramembrane serine protease [Deinococcus sp.]
MIPIRDNIPSRRPAVITKTLLLVTTGVFLYQLTQHATGFRCGGNFLRLGTFDANFALIPALFPDRPLTALTAIFLHGSLWHLVSNMLFLWIFG